MEEETRYCDFCGGELDEDEGTWVNDDCFVMIAVMSIRLLAIVVVSLYGQMTV